MSKQGGPRLGQVTVHRPSDGTQAGMIYLARAVQFDLWAAYSGFDSSRGENFGNFGRLFQQFCGLSLGFASEGKSPNGTRCYTICAVNVKHGGPATFRLRTNLLEYYE